MIRIRKARPDDLPAILELLNVSELLLEGVEQNVPHSLVAEENGRIVATAGLEMGAGTALLRSVAVDPGSRGRGLGVEVVRQALRLASLSGARTVYLLTRTASEFFPRFGFRTVLRAEVEAEFPESAETAPGGSCATAEPMALRDLSRVLEPHPRSRGAGAA